MTLACCPDGGAATPDGAGVATPDMLVDRVAAARKSQDDARNAYFNALQQLRAIATFDGTNLAPMSGRLNSRLEEAKARARDFGGRVDASEAAADAVFREWNGEREQQRSIPQRASLKSRLDRTRMRYAGVRDALRRTRTSLTIALAALNDKALHLDHNLGAGAIGLIRNDLPRIQKGADRLRRDADLSSVAAERFVSEFPAQP